MESQDEFSMNENLEVSAEKGECFYKTIVLGVDSDSIIIGMPMFGNNILLLYEKDWMVIKKTKNDAVYYYSSQVISRWRENQVPMYQIHYPQLFERVQRRKFIRISCMLPINYRGVNLEDVDPITREEFHVSQSIDISGSGVKFYTDLDFSPGKLLEMEIILPDYTVRTHARIVRTSGVKGDINKNDCGQWAAVEHYHLQERERDILVAFIFKKMRERL